MKDNLKTFQNFKTEYLAELGPDAVKEYENTLFGLKIANKLKELRRELNLSQRDFAKRVGKSQSTIARIETGVMIPTIKLLSEIATMVGKRLEVSFVEKA